MEQNNNEMEGWTKIETKIKPLSLQEAIEIQKVLEPIGYELRGYRKTYRTEEFIIRLRKVCFG